MSLPVLPPASTPTECLCARTRVLDPETHAIDLASADFEPASTPVSGEKPKRTKMPLGSFGVLKFTR